jgi:hypothetical protein
VDEQEAAWEGPCVLGDLCGGSHAPERCRLFVDLTPGDRLVVIQRKRLCYLCFRHADSQPCKSQSLPACSVGGCVRMHSKLLHEALQKEETRAIVIEVEEDPEDPEEDEEFYATNFEFLGQEDEDEEEEEEGMEPDEEMPPLLDPDEDRPRLCQQGTAGGQWKSHLTTHTVRLGVEEHLGENGVSQENRAAGSESPQAGHKGLSR